MSSSSDISPSRARAPADGRSARAASESWDGLSPEFLRTAAAQILRALGHPDRLRIIEALSVGPAHVGEIAARLGMSVGRTSRHLGALHDAQVVQRSQRGNHVLYALADRDVARLAAVACRGAATQVRRTIGLAPAGAPDLAASARPSKR